MTSLRSRALFFALVLGLSSACGAPPRVEVGRVEPSPTKPKVVPAGTSAPSLPLPDGWFPIGVPSPRGGSAVVGFDVRLAIDAKLTPWVARASDLVVRVGKANEEGEIVPGVRDLGAFGTRGEEPVLVGYDGVKVVVVERANGSWQSRKLPLLCEPFSLGWARGGSAPALTLDRSGDVWQACIEGIRGPYKPRPEGPSFPEMEWDEHPVVATRLHVARAEGTRWRELPTKALPGVPSMLSVVADATGLLQIRVGSDEIVASKPPSFVVDPSKRTFAPVQGVADVGDDEIRGRRVRREALSVFVHRADACFEDRAAWGSCVRVLGQSSSNGDVRPLVGEAWTEGLVGRAPMHTVALALDEAGAPVVAFDEGDHTAVRRWDGAAFRALPDVGGSAPQGLAVAPDGDVLVGAWDMLKDAPPSIFARNRYTLRRVHGGSVSELPPLVLPRASEWASLVPERTRLRLREGVHLSTVSHEVQARASRLTFVLGDQGFVPEPDKEVMPTTVPYSVAVVPPRFLTPGARFATREAAFSSFTYDAQDRPVIAWAEPTSLHVAVSAQGKWARLDDDRLPPTFALAAPAVAASRDRVCVAWIASGMTPSIFVRCHRTDVAGP